MILILHIIFALSSIVWAGVLWLRPTNTKFYGAYGLVGATLASGTYLVVSSHAPVISSCFTGLVYLAVVFAAIFASYRKAAEIAKK